MMNEQGSPFNPGQMVIRKTEKPVRGTIERVWKQQDGRWRAWVLWEEMLTGSRRWNGGGTEYKTHVLCDALMPATAENIATRQAAWDATRERRARRRAATMCEVAA